MSAEDRVREFVGSRYAIERELGRGGMGTVYLARDLQLDRLVALKVLPAEFAAMSALRERFLRETRTAASFSHPNIVPVYAVEESDDVLAYAMAYVEGESLAERVKRGGPIGVSETVKMLQDTGYALAYAHGRGVVHRDIKPDNIMIERASGRALIMDFGIARMISAPAPTGPEGLTRIGEVIGTPEYMSPEQATGDHVDGRSDLYSLGLTAHFAVTGRAAFSGDTTGKVLVRQITEALPPVQSLRSDLPAPLAAAIDRCVMKEPSDRYQAAEELVEALDAARLARPDVPLAIRMFAQEAGSLSMLLLLGVLAIAMMLRGLGRDDNTSDDLLLPVALLMALLVTRVMQTMREVARLATSGFSASDIHRGLMATVAEREQHRVELKGSEAVRLARRRTAYLGAGQIIFALVSFRVALLFRHARPQGGHQVDRPGLVLVFASAILIGIGIPTLLRSPFRMPLGERLFRLVWLGPIGSIFVRVSGRKIWRRRGAGSAVPVRRERPAQPQREASIAGKAAPLADGRVAALESRVAELERWRTESGPLS